MGNYYQWRAATAGTNATDSDASDSICPKGWKLPTGGGRGTSYDFYKLANAYGVSSSLSGTINGITYNIANAPLSFVRSGFVNPGYHVGYAGRSGYDWSSTAYGSSKAYHLDFDDSSVDLSYGGTRDIGRSVRCIAE